jgi:hypothetical protein
MLSEPLSDSALLAALCLDLGVGVVVCVLFDWTLNLSGRETCLKLRMGSALHDFSHGDLWSDGRWRVLGFVGSERVFGWSFVLFLISGFSSLRFVIISFCSKSALLFSGLSSLSFRFLALPPLPFLFLLFRKRQCSLSLCQTLLF